MQPQHQHQAPKAEAEPPNSLSRGHETRNEVKWLGRGLPGDANSWCGRGGGGRALEGGGGGSTGLPDLGLDGLDGGDQLADDLADRARLVRQRVQAVQNQPLTLLPGCHNEAKVKDETEPR